MSIYIFTANHSDYENKQNIILKGAFCVWWWAVRRKPYKLLPILKEIMFSWRLQICSTLNEKVKVDLNCVVSYLVEQVTVNMNCIIYSLNCPSPSSFEIKDRFSLVRTQHEHDEPALVKKCIKHHDSRDSNANMYYFISWTWKYRKLLLRMTPETEWSLRVGNTVWFMQCILRYVEN